MIELYKFLFEIVKRRKLETSIAPGFIPGKEYETQKRRTKKSI